MASPAVEAIGLTHVYGTRKALHDVSLTVSKGEIFALLGPNGGGKTTLFKIFATLLPPTEGSFRCAGLSPYRDRRTMRRLLGVVFQSPSLDKKLTVEENMRFQGRLFGLSGGELASRIDRLLARLSVADRARDRVESLSGGLARRVEIAKALLHRPEILLLDEPSTGLDPLARRDLRETLKDLAKNEGTTVLLTTHLFEEAEAADRIAILDRGRLIALDTPAALKKEVGGDVLVVETANEADAQLLAADIERRFNGALGAGSPTPKTHVKALAASVRIERPEGHRLIPPLVEAFPGRFRSVTLGAPSLEDVFVAKTGRHFRELDEIEHPNAPA